MKTTKSKDRKDLENNKQTFAVYALILKAFKDFPDFLMRGRMMMPFESYLGLIGVYATEKDKGGYTHVEDMRVLTRKCSWLWSKNTLPKVQPAIQALYQKYLSVLERDQIINKDDISILGKKFYNKAQSLDVTNHKNLLRFIENADARSEKMRKEKTGQDKTESVQKGKGKSVYDSPMFD